MLRFGNAIVRRRKIIIIIALLLLIPSFFGTIGTRINYDVLTYLPSTIDTIHGQDILQDEFGKGGFAMVMVENMDNKDVAKLKSKIEKVDHVDTVIWYDTVLDLSVPESMLPEDVLDNIKNGNLEKILYDLTEKDITKGTITVGKNDYFSFSPEIE